MLAVSVKIFIIAKWTNFVSLNINFLSLDAIKTQYVETY